MRNLIFSRKGIAPVIGTILLSMLAVIASAMLWNYISITTDRAQLLLSPGVDCLSDKTSISTAEYNSLKDRVEVDIKLDSSKKIPSEITLAVNFKDGTSKTFKCGDSCSSCVISTNNNKLTVYLNLIKDDLNPIISVQMYASQCVTGPVNIKNSG